MCCSLCLVVFLPSSAQILHIQDLEQIPSLPRSPQVSYSFPLALTLLGWFLFYLGISPGRQRPCLIWVCSMSQTYPSTWLRAHEYLCVDKEIQVYGSPTVAPFYGAAAPHVLDAEDARRRSGLRPPHHQHHSTVKMSWALGCAGALTGCFTVTVLCNPHLEPRDKSSHQHPFTDWNHAQGTHYDDGNVLNGWGPVQ
jgi:hypothetical protein